MARFYLFIGFIPPFVIDFTILELYYESSKVIGGEQMDIRLDKNNPIPLGVQVKEQIKMLVNSGTYKEGDKLPSINQLALFLGVNKNTVVTILKDLENEGYVTSHRGKGVYISKLKNESKIDERFIGKVDALINDARLAGINVNELINIISARYSVTS
jgi:GntR family transcriptional regulator